MAGSRTLVAGVVLAGAMGLAAVGASGQVAPFNFTQDPANDSDLAFSPDGQRVAFVSDRTGNLEIFVADLVSRQLFNVTDNPARDVDPVFSQDGSQLAFTSDREGNLEIFFINLSEVFPALRRGQIPVPPEQVLPSPRPGQVPVPPQEEGLPQPRRAQVPVPRD